MGGADAAAAARAWLDENRDLYRLASVEELEVDAEIGLTADAHVVVLRQRAGGMLLSPEGTVSVGVVGSARNGWDIATRRPHSPAPTASPERGTSPRRRRSSRRPTTSVPTSTRDDVQREGVRAGWQAFEIEGLEDEPQLVRRVAFPVPGRGVVCAYETVLNDAPDRGFRHLVNAGTGAVLLRTSTVDHADDEPEWSVFPASPQYTPINRYPWNYPSAANLDLWCWLGIPGCRLRIEASSPHPVTPWDVDPRTGTPTFTTVGNYARSAENWFDFLFPGPTGYRPTSPTREYDFPFENVWFENQCDPDVLVEGEGSDIDAATANLFAMHNRFHNWSYHLGFTEHTWNAQDFNFGVGTAEEDPLIGMVQAGAVSHGPPTYAGHDNAFMRTLPDGTPSQTAMFLWQPIPGAFYAPCVDGDFDMTVIGHEYTHMIENRMIGKGINRMGFHAGAMGESVSDFIGMEYLNQYGLVPGGDRAWRSGPT